MDEPLPPTTTRTGQVVIAGGVALLAAALVLSTINARKDGDLDWTNYLVGLAATAVLVTVAVVTLTGRAGQRVDDLVAWPGAVGILAPGPWPG